MFRSNLLFIHVLSAMGLFTAFRSSFVVRVVLLAAVVYLMTVKPGGVTG